MKTLVRNSIHQNDYSHDCLVAEIKGKKAKLTYQAYNAAEKCKVEFFDGDKWNSIFSIFEMGIIPEPSAYNIWDEAKRKRRADDLFKKAEELCNKIL